MELDDPLTLCSECNQLSKLASAQSATPNTQSTLLISSISPLTTDADLQARVEELEALIRAAQNSNHSSPAQRTRGPRSRPALRSTMPTRDAIMTLTSDTDSDSELYFDEEDDDADESSNDDELVMLLDDESVSAPLAPVPTVHKHLAPTWCSLSTQAQLSSISIPAPAPAPPSLHDILAPEELLDHLCVSFPFIPPPSKYTPSSDRAFSHLPLTFDLRRSPLLHLLNLDSIG